MSDQLDLGGRIRQLRGKLLTQRELADRALVSVDLIRKLEQGRRHTASIGSLQRIARALDVGIAELLGRVRHLPTSDSTTGVIALRRALAPVDDLVGEAGYAEDALSVAEAERTVAYATGCYWSGKYALLASMLPGALGQLRATVRAVPAAERPLAARVLAQGYDLAGSCCVHLGQEDAAFLAVREALRVAQESDDELLAAALRVSVSWQLLVSGRFDEAERVAVIAAETVEPRGDVSDSQLALHGILAVTAATAAARSRRRDSANDLLGVARAAATRLGYERRDHQTSFGVDKVGMLEVDVRVVQDDFAGALTAAKRLPRDAALPLAVRARHLADIALSQLRLGRDDRALTTVLTMEQLAPQWIVHQPLPRQIVAELVENERRVSAPLRELALRLGALAG